MHSQLSDLISRCCLSTEGSSCCGPSSSDFVRRYSTKEERKAKLEEYISMLEKELEGAREHLKDLK